MAALDEIHFDLRLAQGRPFQVIGLGENAVDWVCRVADFPRHDSKTQMEGTVVRLGGGTIATACTVCARYGLRTRYVGRIGDDEAGEFSRIDLAKEPMEVLVETVHGAFSHFSLIIVDRATGKRTIIWNRDPKLHYGEGELALARLMETQILLLDTSDGRASLAALRKARSAGVRTVLDIDRVQPEAEELLAWADFAIPDEGFVREFSGHRDWRKGLRVLAELCGGILIVTLGEAGAALIWEDRICQFDGLAVDVVDSTAAGDVFHGAFIYALLQGWPIGRCMRFSNCAGALACTRLGARASVPLLHEVLEKERSHRWRLI